MTKEELDQALVQVTAPAPVILVGPWHPIATFAGYNDPYEGFYRGVRVQVHLALDGGCVVLEGLQPSLPAPDEQSC